MVAFRERTFGHQRHQHPASREPRTLCSGAQAAQLLSFSPPASGGAACSAPAGRRRNWSCRTEAGGRGQTEPGRNREEKQRTCGCAAPPLVPARLEGPGRGAAKAPGGTELGGHRVRAALGGGALPPIPSGPPPSGGNRWRKPSGSRLS